MVDTIVRLREGDINGAVLPDPVVEDNEVKDLIRWLNCRGFTANANCSKKSLINRVKDLQDSGLAQFVVDPDGSSVSAVADSGTVNFPFPLVRNWTTNMGSIPRCFNYSSIVDYLVKRKLMVVCTADSDNEDSITITDLPVAQKPLRKGFNFFKSGHVSDVKFNKLEEYTHVTSKVLSSYKSTTYKTDLILKNVTGEIMKGNCKCAAGLGGKCNHVAGVLFGLLDFQQSFHDAPESCTSKEQKWHQPSRKAKKLTKPIKTGIREVQKHVYGHSVRRKRPLENYDGYCARLKKTAIDTSALKEDLKQLPHETGLLMILNSSTDTASEGEEERTATSTHQLPEEIVCQKLKVTEEKQKAIEKQTRGQANNPLWFRHKKGRITASKAKKFVGKGDVGTLVKDIIQIRKPKSTSIPALKYGIDNEAVALEKYKQQKKEQSVNITVDVCGLFVDLEFGQLAASPDGLVTDPSEKDPHGLVEIKCIYSCRDISPKEAIEKRSSSSQFPLKAVGETVIMKESHSHYYQIQMQMGVTKRRWCDFVLFTKEDEDVLILRVNFDPGFWEKVKEKLLDFHTMNIVPALVAQGFYKKW